MFPCMSSHTCKLRSMRPVTLSHKFNVLCRQVTLDFMNNCQELAARILACFASGLGMPEGFFEQVRRIFSSNRHLCCPLS